MTADTFAATYSTFRHVQGRKVIQFVFEVPIEKASGAFRVLGGMPNIDQSVWVAIARLDPGKAEQAVEPPQKAAEGINIKRYATPFHKLPVGSQAALACKDGSFQEWLAERCRGDVWEGAAMELEDITTDRVRNYFGVKSRADIDQLRWQSFYAEFEQAVGRMARAEGD